MKRITNRKTDDGYTMTAGRQSLKITADVKRTGTRWTMTLPTGERVDRQTIADLKHVFGEYVAANYGKKPGAVQRVTAAVTPDRPKRQIMRPATDQPRVTPHAKRQCPSAECDNTRYFAFTTCLSCHYAKTA